MTQGETIQELLSSQYNFPGNFKERTEKRNSMVQIS